MMTEETEARFVERGIVRLRSFFDETDNFVYPLYTEEIPNKTKHITMFAVHTVSYVRHVGIRRHGRARSSAITTDDGGGE